MFHLDDQSIFFDFKSQLLLTNEFFLSKHNHTIFFIVSLDPNPN
jgi:hypothetical protein